MDAQTVIEAAQTLVEEGRKPTVRAVRQQIGAGSLRDIHAALRQWREGGGTPAAPEQTPGAVSATAREQAEELWKIARRVADARLEAKRQELEAARAAAEAELSDMITMADELRGELVEARAARDSARSMLAGERQRWEREAASMEARALGAANRVREVLAERDEARQEVRDALQRAARLEGQVQALRAQASDRRQGAAG